MKQIELTQGQVTWVDNWNYDWLSQWKWCAKWSERGQCFYATRTDYSGGKQKTVRMHRVIMNTPDDMDTDHVDGDTLFNLECNLRVCSTAENARNRGKSKNNTSGYKGVYWHKRIGKWSACLRYYGKLLHLGYYDIPEDAARAYDERAKELHGEFAVLNFQQLQGLV